MNYNTVLFALLHDDGEMNLWEETSRGVTFCVSWQGNFKSLKELLVIAETYDLDPIAGTPANGTNTPYKTPLQYGTNT